MTTSLDPAYQRDIKDAETNGTRHDIDEAQDLEREFGYIQELPRVRVYHASRRSLLIAQTKSFFSLWMMTIVLSSIPYGLSTTLCQYPDLITGDHVLMSVYPFTNGGAIVAVWDWLVMSSIYICVAVSLGEIASRYPVSGGLYYWSHRLSPPSIASLVSYIVGWIAVVGNVTVTLSVNFA